MDLEFTGILWYWRGPAPFHFVTVPDEQGGLIAMASEMVTYGWGMVPVTARIGATEWTTSLWPKDGGYIVPVRAAVRTAERIELDDAVSVRLVLGV